VKNREKSEKIGTPGKIHNQMVNSMLIARNLWIWTYSILFNLWKKNYRYFLSLFLNTIKSSIYVNWTWPSFRRLASKKSNRFGSSIWLLHIFHFVNALKLLCPWKLFKLAAFGDLFASWESQVFPFTIVGKNRCNTNCKRKTLSHIIILFVYEP